MAQLLKMASNAPLIVQQLKHLETDWMGALKKVTFEVMEISRLRFLSQMIRGGGIVKGKRIDYRSTAEMNVPRFGWIRQKNEGGKRVYAKITTAENYFHSGKLVSRSGETVDMFERKMPGLIMDTKRESNQTIGIFGVQGGGGYAKYSGKAVGSVEARIASHETGMARGGYRKKARKPMWKSLQYGVKRFDTLMMLHLQNVERTFNARAA